MRMLCIVAGAARLLKKVGEAFRGQLNLLTGIIDVSVSALECQSGPWFATQKCLFSNTS